MPESGDFRDQIKSTAALGRWADCARLIADSFDKARDDEERLGWAKLLLRRERFREPCPPLKAWLDKHIAARKPISPQLAYQLGLDHRGDADLLLTYARLWLEQGHSSAAQTYAMRAVEAAVRRRSSEDCVEAFRFVADNFPEDKQKAVEALLVFKNPPQEVLALVHEPALDELRELLKGAYRYDWQVKRILNQVKGLPRTNALAEEMLADPKGAPAAAAFCAFAGLTDLPQEELWRKAAEDPAAIVLSRRYMDHLKHLRGTARWDEAIAFVKMLERSPYHAPADLGPDILLQADRREEAVAWARERDLFGWLVEHGEEEPAREVTARRIGELGEPGTWPEYANQREDVRRHLFALRVWEGKVSDAAGVFASSLPDLREEATLSNEFSDLVGFAVMAFHPDSGPEHRKQWKNSDAGWDCGLALASQLLEGNTPRRGWERSALAALCCIPAARNGSTRDVRARAYSLIARAFEHLNSGGYRGPALQVCNYVGAPWERSETDPLDPLPQHLFASIAAAEACGGFAPRMGLPFEPNYDGWGKLPRAKRLELLRRASRLLELRPVSGPMRRDDLSALEHYEYPAELAEDDPDFVPTPRQWLMREMRRRRHLCVRSD